MIRKLNRTCTEVLVYLQKYVWAEDSSDVNLSTYRSNQIQSFEQINHPLLKCYIY